MIGQSSLLPIPPPPTAGQTVTAISLYEPWASLMRTGAKTIETRHWPTTVRGWLLICASKRRNLGELREVLSRPAFQEGLRPLLREPLVSRPQEVTHTLDFGTVVAGRGDGSRVEVDHLLFGSAVALVYLHDCRPTKAFWDADFRRERELGNFEFGRFAFVTRGLHRFRPFPVTGKQGFFTVELPADFVAEAA